MYRSFYRHILSRLDAEQVHNWTMRSLRGLGNITPARMLWRAMFTPTTNKLYTNLFGLNFAHPIGLAAGLDKNASALPALTGLGFSFIEVGTITPRPQPGNPPPRMFRLPHDHALINRMGFPSAGMDVVEANLKAWIAYCQQHPGSTVPLGISLGKNKETPLTEAYQDYSAVLQRLHAYADFFVINVSSPNTPELRKLQTRDYLSDLLANVMETMHSLNAKPLLIKISPDLSYSEIDTLLELVQQHSLSGIIATNTTTARPNLHGSAQTETGGLSGQPLRQRSTEIIRYCYQHTAGKLPIIGVGGIFTGDDVWEKLTAGASLVQAYTGFIYEGPFFVRKIIRRLSTLMTQQNVAHITEIIGKQIPIKTDPK